MAKRFYLMGLMILPLACFAEQRLPIKEGVSVTATLSSTALNRIVVENDRIASVKGTAGQFLLDKDAELGQIFIQPTMSEQKEPIHLFMTTEKGHTYSLNLLSDKVPAENILLVPIEQKAVAEKWEKSSDYEVIITNLIKAMHTQTPIDGYLVRLMDKKCPMVANASVNHVKSYCGDKLQGEHYEIKNPHHEPINLSEADFYTAGVRAIAIMHKTLNAKSSTEVYLVKNRYGS